jgi:hypothetical protein
VTVDHRASDDAAQNGSAPSLLDRVRAFRPRPLGVLITLLLVAQLAALIVYSTSLFDHFDLTDDFATYTQAWWLIGHGHLNPVDTIHVPSFPFWQNHFEIAMWPIAWIGRVWPNPLSLLYLQDVAIVATELIVSLWIVSLCREVLNRHSEVVAVVGVLALLANLWWYETASFDVHFETLGLPFVVLCAYLLFRRGSRWALLSAGIGVLFGDVVAISVFLVAIAGLVAGPRARPNTRINAAWVAAISGLWLVLVFSLNGNQGSGLASNYGYLVNASPGASGASIISALIHHPAAALRVLRHRWSSIGRVLGASGVLGVLTPWGFFVAAGTLLPAALNVNPEFIAPIAAFQTLVVIPFVVVGTVSLLVRFVSIPRVGVGRLGFDVPARGRVFGAWLAAAGLVTLGLVQNVPLASQIRTDWWRVNTPASAILSDALARTPSDAEVIASQGVIGRFAERPYLYTDVAAPQAFPLHASTVVFVLSGTQGIESVPPAAEHKDVEALLALGAHFIIHRDGIDALVWHPSQQRREIVLP